MLDSLRTKSKRRRNYVCEKDFFRFTHERFTFGVDKLLRQFPSVRQSLDSLRTKSKRRRNYAREKNFLGFTHERFTFVVDQLL